MIPGSRPVLVCHTPEEHDWEPLATVHGPVARLCNRCGAYEMHEDAKDAEPPEPTLEELAASAVRRTPPGPPPVPAPDAHRPVG